MITTLLLSFLIGWCVNDVNQMQENEFPVHGEIKGFVHSNDGEWFLTDLPVLKSCCQTKPNEDEVVYLTNFVGLHDKRLYTFVGEIQQKGNRKVLIGEAIRGGERGLIPFMVILSGAFACSFLAAKKRKK